MLQTVKRTDIATKIEMRKEICDFEEMIGSVEGAIFGDSDMMPLKHTFTPGMYVREIFLPKGAVCVGKIHRHEHPSFLMSGVVDVATEDGGLERITAPVSMVSPSGTKRAVYAVEDSVWITVHLNPTDTTDLEEIEEEVIAKDYKELECHPIKEITQ